MKVKIFILTVFLLTNIMMISCKEDNPVPTVPTVPTKVSTLDIVVTPSETINYLYDATISWKSTNLISLSVGSLQLDENHAGIDNGVKYSLSDGATTLKYLKKDTILLISGVGLYNPIQKFIHIKVVPNPKPTRTDSICAKVWRQTEEKVWVDDEWVFPTLSDIQLRKELHYYPDGNLRGFDPTDNRLLVDTNWSWISKDSILIGGGRYKYSLFADTFIRSERNGTVINTYKAMP